MVKYKLISKENGLYIYEYYPKGNYSKKCGIVKLDTNKKGIEISIVAEEDFLYIITAKELNKSRDIINVFRKENGEKPLTEEELPMLKEDVKRYYYGSHVVNKIWEDFIGNTMKEEGMVAWY